MRTDVHALAAEPFIGPRRWPAPPRDIVRAAMAARAEAAATLAAAQMEFAFGLTPPVAVEPPSIEAIEPPTVSPASPSFDRPRAVVLFAWAQRIGGPAAEPFTSAFEDMLIADVVYRCHNRVIWQRRGRMARLLVTCTPLGWSAGVHYDAPMAGACEGGGLEPCWDDEGSFYWENREAAYHAAGRALLLEALRHGDDRTAGHVRGYHVNRMLDGDRDPAPVLKQRFVSRAEISVAVEPPLAPEGGDTSEARRAFERAEGLTDVDEPQPGPAPTPIRRPREQPPCERLTGLMVAAGIARKPKPAEVAYVQAAIAAILPPGVPSYAEAVVYVRRTPGVTVARLRLWDGETGTLRITGEPGGHGYRWEETGREDRRPFHWDADEGGWSRIDEEPTP